MPRLLRVSVPSSPKNCCAAARLRRQLSPSRCGALRGTLTEPARTAPTARRRSQEKLRLFREMRLGKFADGEHRPAREDRHGLAQHQPARPGLYRIRHASHHPHRRPLVHLSHLRLGARRIGRARAHHAPRSARSSRGPPAALRMVQRAPRRGLDRIRRREEARPPAAAGCRNRSSSRGST